MKMEGWAERIGVGLVGLVLGALTMGLLTLSLGLWDWSMLTIPPVCMILAMIIGEPVINWLKALISHDVL